MSETIKWIPNVGSYKKKVSKFGVKVASRLYSPVRSISKINVYGIMVEGSAQVYFFDNQMKTSSHSATQPAQTVKNNSKWDKMFTCHSILSVISMFQTCYLGLS
jgi:hypothetical protein